jgi:hypothetical protein
MLLNIPGHVIKNVPNPPLLLGYEKYKHYCLASKALDTMRSAGSWPDNCRQPTATELIEIFVAKTTWYVDTEQLSQRLQQTTLICRLILMEILIVLLIKTSRVIAKLRDIHLVISTNGW